MPEPLLQIVLALAYYAGLVTMMRLAGKRLATLEETGHISSVLIEEEHSAPVAKEPSGN